MNSGSAQLRQNPGSVGQCAMMPRFGHRPRAARSLGRDVRRLLSRCRDLLSAKGEVSGVRLATDALLTYQSLSEVATWAFFDALTRDFSSDPTEIERAADAFRADPSQPNLAWLQRAVETPRRELFRRLNFAPGGAGQLIALRQRLLQLTERHPEWAPVEADLAHLLSSWFNPGFLHLRRIDSHSAPAILEKLIQYESVHQIQGWDDLRRRLDADRRCYAFFHPALAADDPIIFVEVALTRGISGKIQPLLNPRARVMDPRSANCAMFYSITNCQDGLRGIPFGGFLINRVAEEIGKEHPQVRTFATLSPVPGFRKWMGEMGEKPEQLAPLCARYLLNAKRGREPLDSVARFHLRNGARLHRVNPAADPSPGGMKRSAGLMVNYLYDFAEMERNHELYTREFRVSASPEVETLAGQASDLR
jgi:malonyl-CoA decarboxylase